MKQLLSKPLWKKRLPEGCTLPQRFNLIEGTSTFEYTQQRMLDEYYPTSHDIFNHFLYPDIPHEVDVLEEVIKTDENGKAYKDMVPSTKTYIEPIPRTAVSYQQIIETKRTDHLCGNDATFERNWSDTSEKKDNDYQELVDGWEQMDMEDAFFLSVHNCNIVADVAHVQYIYTDEWGEKKMGWNVYSFFKGDHIYAHRDPRTLKTYLFARVFSDDQGVEKCEVWDDANYYLFGMPKFDGSVERPTHYEFADKMGGEPFSLDGYTLISTSRHGCNRCPVSYHRNDDGPVWSFSQDSIEAYEEDLNGLRHNNKAYGTPILVTKGDDVEGTPELDGTVKNINMGKDDDAKLLQGASASESYMSTLDKLENLIYLQSFIVKTPELKSGDLPAAALKILYSPSVEKAMHECKDWQPFINDMFDIFRYYFGLIKGKTIDFSPSQLPIKVYVTPYVHQSESTMVADIAAAVQNKFLSRQTASARIPWMAEEGEWDRIVAEEKEAQEADLLYQESLVNVNQQNQEE